MLPIIVHLVGALGLVGVALLMAVENVIIPLPSELIMPLAGFLAARGYMSLPGVIIAGTIGSVAGGIPVYWVAQKLGEERIAAWIEAHGHWMRIRARDIEKANARFKRHGGRAVFFSQLIPGLRVLISIPAGVARMSLTRFIVTNLAGTFIWCAVLALAGAGLGIHFQTVDGLVKPLLWVGLLVFLAVSAVWVWRRRHRRGLA